MAGLDTVQPGQSLADIARLLADKRLPPVERWNPPYCGAIDMVIKRDGSWLYLGSPIGRHALVKLFSTVLRRDEDGRYYLVTPVEKLQITVEDAPFVAVELVSEGKGGQRRLGFRLNTDDYVIAGPNNRLRVEVDGKTGEPRPYIHVRRGLEALINRPVFYELVSLAMEEGGETGTLGLWSDGVFFPLGDTGGGEIGEGGS
ncbi:DUF1285 domain-containing protein [Pedomonas mirosovicensis]|uniref:DUF1285 domain-containing protein n=1 Tax=Pedomonas mirosovicensis TaxID=2908641 RepID=UPI0021694F80|nr:DUF1285 domain-containing protein [Pedomonas mirosovicensis]MCH8684299.1 DUF1285 domain-containing protein [Pedomonas mirosovicensis]